MRVRSWVDAIDGNKVVASEKFKGAHKDKSREVRSPTCEVLGAVGKHLGQSHLGSSLV